VGSGLHAKIAKRNLAVLCLHPLAEARSPSIRPVDVAADPRISRPFSSPSY